MANNGIAIQQRENMKIVTETTVAQKQSFDMHAQRAPVCRIDGTLAHNLSAIAFK